MKPPTFHPIPPDQLPQDDARGRHKGWKFKTLEHDQYAFPHAIEATDAKGRKCVYVVLTDEAPADGRGTIGMWKS